jgi:hypothetical protein
MKKRVPNSGSFKKGHVPWSKLHGKGKHFSKATEFKKGQHYSVKTEFTSERMSNEKHPNWKGDSVGYFGLHTWVQRKKGKVNQCELCGKIGRIDWANKSYKYKRDLNDWVALCHKCHFNRDKNKWGLATKLYGLKK